MSDHHGFFQGRRFARRAGLAANIAGEGDLLHAAMNSGFFEGLEGGGLGVGQSGFGAAFGESPAAASAGLDQQEFDAGVADAIADGGYLVGSAQTAKLSEADEFS